MKSNRCRRREPFWICWVCWACWRKIFFYRLFCQVLPFVVHHWQPCVWKSSILFQSQRMFSSADRPHTKLWRGRQYWRLSFTSKRSRKTWLRDGLLFGLIGIHGCVDLGFLLFLRPCILPFDDNRKSLNDGSIGFVLEAKSNSDGVVAFGVEATDIEAFGED